jgi:hypothetical protein
MPRDRIHLAGRAPDRRMEAISAISVMSGRPGRRSMAMCRVGA